MTLADPETVGLELHGAAIRATANLHPLKQVDALVSLHEASGEDAPSFASFLIGELVLTRMRLAAADPKALCALVPVAA